MKFSTYIFDLDGTLLDTLGDLAASVNYALRTCDMPEHSIEDVRSFVGNGVRLLMERAVPDGVSNPRFDEAFSTFRQHYLAHSLDTTKPYDGILEMLAALKANGCRMAVVSNKFYAATQELCRHFFAGTIDVAIGEHEAEGIRKKPAPDTVFEALRHTKKWSRDFHLRSNRTLIFIVKDSAIWQYICRGCQIPDLLLFLL